jgi:hypothetical protein
MTDDSNSRYRTSDPSNSGPAQAGAANDPLAELARLIGQSDPFTETGRGTHPQAPRSAAAATYRSEPAPLYRHEPGPAADRAPDYRGEPAEHYGSAPAPDDRADTRFGRDPYPGRDAAPFYGSETRASRDAAPHYGSGGGAHFGAAQEPHYADEQPAPADWPGAPAQSYPPASPTDPYAMPPLQRASMLPASESHYDDFPDPRFRPNEDDDEGDRAGYGTGEFQPGSGRPPFPSPLYPQEPEGGQMPPPHDDEFYDDAPRGDRRKGLLTVAAVLALAVIGTAGAFGYRSYFSGSTSSAPPPVIRASGEPSKVAPPPAKADPAASKFSYDRFGDRGKDEQVVVREEKPVDSTELARSSAPRSVFPAVPAAGSPPNSVAPSMSTAPSALGEPKRVRTVHIRPDQPDIPAIPQSVAAAPPMPLAPPQTNAAGGIATSPEVLAAPTARAASSPAQTSRPPARVATRVAPPPTAPAANAPLSLSPGGNDAPPPPVQESAPVRAAAPPARLASAPAASGGGYLVQVSSQRSEADAQTSYRNIQARYPSVLGSHPHLVRRADLGSRGVYYRAMVGPFGSRDQAIALCSSLKAAGGDCVVQAN